MNEYSVKRFGLMLAIQAEIEGMKAENDQRKINGIDLVWDRAAFCDKAEELNNLAFCHDDQL
jgi:hypothetical protein